jgi:hypothetical protein
VDATIDWDGTSAIRRNCDALRRVVTGLVAKAGLVGDRAFRHRGSAPPDGAGEEPGRGPSQSATLPRYLYLAVLRILRPAESAARRLIIAAARTLVVTAPPPRPRKPKRRGSAFLRKPGGTGILLPRGMAVPGAKPRTVPRVHGFPLLDPLNNPLRKPARRRAQSVPRISVPGFTTPFPIRPPPSSHDPMDATRLVRRLAALAAALDDMPGQARRFARWRARRDAARGNRKDAAAVGVKGPPAALRRLSPLRPGRPPGTRPARWRRDGSEVDGILAHAHSLAVFALADTS